ncbi:MAG: DUF2007 domain-containing protein [Thiotrichales bacterium]
MRRVYTAPTPLMTGFIQGILEHAGIDYVLKNQFLSGAAGDLPINETWPELWVRDADEARALELIQEILAPLPTAAREWLCPECGEQLEMQFCACWRCGRTRIEQEPPR